MADNSVPTAAGAFELQFWRMAGQVRVCMPGNITSFDSATQRCAAKPGIKMKVVDQGKASYVDLPEVQNVPVVVPYAQGAGLLLSLPIKAGDPCLLLFADRAMDNFLQKGESEMPGSALSEDTTAPRVHHLTDAICIPGLITDGAAVPQWSEDNIELRDFERKHFISLGPGGIQISDSVATMTMQDGVFSVVTPKTSTIQSSNMTLGGSGGTVNEIENSLTSRNGTFIDANGRDSSAHTHGNVEPGSGTSGPTNG